jgi:3-mercaptopyruvate sulfurtransferase SseA
MRNHLDDLLHGRVVAAPRTNPIILNVGPKMLYLQAHIPGAEYIGPGSDPESIKT